MENFKSPKSYYMQTIPQKMLSRMESEVEEEDSFQMSEIDEGICLNDKLKKYSSNRYTMLNSHRFRAIQKKELKSQLNDLNYYHSE